MGMLFNRRRQSQDRVLRDYLLTLCPDRPLLMNAYSGKQFSQAPQDRIAVREDFLEAAGPGDYCFVEDRDLKPLESRLETVILCRWNRAYPGDRKLDLELAAWKLLSATEFSGSSHEKITVEVYGR